MARQGNPISVRLDLNRCSDSSWFCDYYYGKLVYQDVNLRSYFGSIRPPTHLTFGFRLGGLIILHFPKRTFIHFFFPRRVFPKRRKKTRPGKTKGRGAGKRVESTRRAKQNDRSLWKIKKKGYGYHDRSPSIKKNLSKLLWVSGTFKHPKYAGVVVNDDSFGKTKLFKCFFERKSRSDDPTSDLLKRTFPAVRPSLNYSVMQYLLNRKNKMHFDPVVVLMNLTSFIRLILLMVNLLLVILWLCNAGVRCIADEMIDSVQAFSGSSSSQPRWDIDLNQHPLEDVEVPPEEAPSVERDLHRERDSNFNQIFDDRLKIEIREKEIEIENFLRDMVKAEIRKRRMSCSHFDLRRIEKLLNYVIQTHGNKFKHRNLKSKRRAYKTLLTYLKGNQFRIKSKVKEHIAQNLFDFLSQEE